MKTTMQVLAFILILNSFLHPQNKLSLQIDGCIIAPFQANTGTGYDIQLNYNYVHNNSLFLDFSNSSWDKNKLVFHEPNGTVFNEHNEENHSLFSIFLGNRFKFFRYKTLRTFLSFMLGYQKLDYTEISLIKYTNPDGSFEYINDYSQQKKINDNLFGLGFGLGIMNHITNSFGIQLSLKLNSFINGSYNGLFSKNGTYLNYIGGIFFNI